MIDDWNKVDLLEMVEELASDWKMISSEEELSEMFDEQILPLVIEKYGEEDQCAIDQAFNDWTDSLCKDGQIHEEQYNKYCYVGRCAE